jgi:ABC-2 type transport system permease protein
MRRSFKAELLKLVTTRGYLWLVLGAIAVVILTTASTVASAQPGSLSGALHDEVFFLLVTINVGIFSLVTGIRSVTDEFRYSTAAHSFLADPRRWRTVTMKAATAALGALVLAAVSAVVMIAIALPLASVKDGTLAVSNGDAGAMAGFLVGHALWAVLGVGIGYLVRYQVPAIVGGIVWILVVENLGSGFLGEGGAYLPGQAAYAFARSLEKNPLEAGAGGALMAAYALLLFFLGLASVRRRDVL